MYEPTGRRVWRSHRQPWNVKRKLVNLGRLPKGAQTHGRFVPPVVQASDVRRHIGPIYANHTNHNCRKELSDVESFYRS